MAYRVEVVSEECMSAGRCVADFPQAFGFDDDELSVVLPTASSVSNERLVLAARNCPSRAIRVFDDSGEEIDV